MSLYRKDIVAECLEEIKSLLLEAKAFEAAGGMECLHTSVRDNARARKDEVKELVSACIRKVNYQIDLLKDDLLQVEREIEILDAFPDLVEAKQQLEVNINETEKQLQHATGK